MRTTRPARTFALGLLAVFAASTAGPAQAAVAPSSLGTDFWLGFEANVDTSNVNTLFIAGPQASSGTVTIPGLGFTKAYTTTPGAVTSVVLPADSTVQTADGVEAKAIHVTASVPVTVYGLNRRNASTDAFLGLPVSVLGTDHLVLGYKNTTDYFKGTQFAVVASEDDTTATVTPATATAAHAEGVPFTVHLNRGDVYQLRAETQMNLDLTGSSVTSDKPVAVFAGNQIANVPDNNYYAGDHLVEQMPKTDAWGKSFVTVPLASRTKGDTFRVLAAQDGTTITVNGVNAGTVDRGEYVQQVITGRSEIIADKPVLVAQYSNSTNFDGPTASPSDPFEMLIPPNEQFLNDYTVSTPASGFGTNFINVVAPTSAVGEVTLDGAVIPAAKFSPIGSSGFSGAQLAVSLGSHRMHSRQPFGISVYGFDTFDSYGYPGGLSLAPISDVAAVQITADSTTPSVGSQDCFTAAVTDQGEQPVAGVRVDFDAAGSNNASGFAVADDQGQARFCYTGDHAGPDDVTAAIGTVDDTTTVTWAEGNGAPHAAFTDTPQAPVSGDPVAFDGTPSSDDHGIESYVWDFGDGTTGTGSMPEHTYTKPGTYAVKLTVTDAAGLTDTVTHEVTVANQPPTARFGATPDAPHAGTLVAFDGSASSDPDGEITKYEWDFGDGTTGTGPKPEHTYTKPGTYEVTETVTDDTGTTGTVTHTVTVANQPPTAAFTGTPASPRSGDPIALDGTSSSDPDGTIATYAWDYGDGTTGTGASPQHTYDTAGTYTVTLTVTDDLGATGTVSHTVTVAVRRSGSFVCRATALRLPLIGEVSVANAPLDPCRKASKSLVDIKLGMLLTLPLGASVLSAETAQSPEDLKGTVAKAGDGATAQANVATATVLAGTTIVSARGVEANASATCTKDGGVALEGQSEIASLTVNGQTYKTADLGIKSLDIPLLVGTLHINKTIKSGGKVTQRVVWLESPLTGDIVIGEAVAGTAGEPCR
ncbi:MAG: Bacterial Ig-like domain protein [Solirubrobacterales bacterium]|nr:Bacterial Ig-like domain protein [Solirubrobacterales bacterium]